jgi:hypothetical protein
MTTITHRVGGAPLTNAQIDANFDSLNTNKLELSGGTMTGTLGGVDITMTGSAIFNGGFSCGANISTTAGNVRSTDSAYPGMHMTASGNGTDLKVWWTVVGATGKYEMWSWDDALTTSVTQFTLDRSGNGTFTGGVNANGNVLVSAASGPYSTTTGRRYLTVQGVGGTSYAGVFQAAHGATDADTTVVGNYEFIDPNQTGNKRIGYVGMLLNGSTANQRGADMVFGTRKNNNSAATEVMRLCRNGATSSDITESVFAFDYPSYSGSGNPGVFGMFGNGSRSVLLQLNGSGATDKSSGISITDNSSCWNMTAHHGGTLRWSYGQTAANQTDSTIAANSAMTLVGGGSGLSVDTVLTLRGLTTALVFNDKGRIKADFSASTRANRTMVQDSGTDKTTSLGIIPSGTATNSNVTVYNTSDPDNAGFMNMQVGTITTNKTGTGTAPALTLAPGGFSTLTGAIADGAWTVGANWTQSAGNFIYGAANVQLTGVLDSASGLVRPHWQSTFSAGSTRIGLIPSSTGGGGTIAAMEVYNASDPNNSAFMNFRITSVATVINSTKIGTGTALDLSIQNQSTTALQCYAANASVQAPVGLGVGMAPDSGNVKLIVQNTQAIAGAAASVRDLRFATGTDASTAGLRWIVRCDGTAEAGSNAGSDFQIHARSDAGAQLFSGNTFTIRRSTGQVGIATTAASIPAGPALYVTGDYGTTGKITSYNGSTLTGNGVPTLLYSKLYTGQTAAFAATNLIASLPADGMYRVSMAATVTRAATTSSEMGGTNGFKVTFVSAGDGVSKTINGVAADRTTANTVNSATSRVLMLYGKAANALSFTYDYTSVGATTLQYEIYITVEYLGPCT